MPSEKATRSSPVLGALVRFAVPAGARLPIRLAQAIGGAIGALGSIIPNRRREVASRNIAMCLPELGEDDRAHLVRRNMVETGKSALELGALWARPPESLTFLEAEVIGDEIIHRALDDGKGVVFLAPHVGNWEFLNHFLMRFPASVGLYRSPRVAELDHFMRQARQRTGTTLVPATTSGVRQLLRALRDRRVVAILPDQEPVREAGVFAPFFGVPALTMTLVHGLMCRTGAVACFAYAQRTPRGRFSIRVKAAPEGLDDPDQVTAVGRLNLGVERCVRACTEQYLWTYKRFRTRPDGESSPYDTRP